METILLVVYIVLAYWAVGELFFKNKVVIHSFGALFFFKLCLGLFLGIFLIPIAIFKTILTKN